VLTPAPSVTKEQNSNAIISRINAGMLINCEKNIKKEQIAELLKYKTNSDKFDSSQAGYRSLVDIPLS